MTPVEELFQLLWDTPQDKLTWFAIKKRMLEKEKEVIMDAYISGDDSDCLQEQEARMFAQVYYNETFKTKEK